MRLLVIGTGVIGTTYAWQLMQAGCEVTHYDIKMLYIWNERGLLL